MKVAWLTLIISALTDLVITIGTSIATAMVSTGDAVIPNNAVLILAGIGGLVSAARTVNQALKATPEVTAALKGTGDGT